MAVRIRELHIYHPPSVATIQAVSAFLRAGFGKGWDKTDLEFLLEPVTFELGMYGNTLLSSFYKEIQGTAKLEVCF